MMRRPAQSCEAASFNLVAVQRSQAALVLLTGCKIPRVKVLYLDSLILSLTRLMCPLLQAGLALEA
jgi:hypothetical protein